MAMRDWEELRRRRATPDERPALRVRHVMSWPALALSQVSSVELALRVAVDNRFHHFPVLRDGELVGVVCTCDLRDAPLAASVKRYMSRQRITVEPDASLKRAVELMDEEGVNCLPTRIHHTWGIITRRDLVRAGACVWHTCSRCGDIDHVRLDRETHRWRCIACAADLL